METVRWLEVCSTDTNLFKYSLCSRFYKCTGIQIAQSVLKSQSIGVHSMNKTHRGSKHIVVDGRSQIFTGH